MSALKSIPLNSPALGNAAVANQDAIKEFIAEYFWRWYDVHLDDRIITVKILIFNKTIRVRDLESLFVMLFGNRK